MKVEDERGVYSVQTERLLDRALSKPVDDEGGVRTRREVAVGARTIESRPPVFILGSRKVQWKLHTKRVNRIYGTSL